MNITKFPRVCYILSILVALFVLSGCSPVYNTSHTFQSPTSWDGKQCVNKCIGKRSDCKIQCEKLNQKCRDSARLTALPAYLAYTQNKEEQAKNPHKTIESFANYSHCNASCNCDNDYNQCFANCGGTVTEHRQCVAFCDKVPSNQLRQSSVLHQ